MNMRHGAIVSIGLLAIASGLILYCLFLWQMPVKTLVINNFQFDERGVTPIHIDTPVVHPGDILRYELDYCKFTNITPSSKSQLIDGQIIPLTPPTGAQSGLPVGCHKTVREVVIPETVNPGRYYYNKELDYQVNVFRVEEVHYYTEYFQVVDKSVPSTSSPVSEETKESGKLVYPASLSDIINL